MTADSIHLRVASNETNIDKTLDKKRQVDWQWLCIWAFDLCCATIWGYAVGDKDKRSTNARIMYAMILPSLYLIQIATEWGIFRRQMVCANAGYLLSNPSTGVRRANYLYSSSTEKSSAQRSEIKTKDMGTTLHKAMGVGSPTTIHRASKCLPQVVWYLQCIQKTNMNAWIRKKPKDCYSKWWTYLSLIHIWRCRRYAVCRSRWSPYH